MGVIDSEKVIANVKEDLGIQDALQDKILERLCTKVCDHFKLAYKVDEIEKRFSFIIEDCIIKRFNRRGAEGAKSESMEGYSMSYVENQYEFEEYDSLLQEELKAGKSKAGKVVIL